MLQAVIDGEIVGGAILFVDKDGETLYIGRRFIDPVYHRKRYGLSLMKMVEAYYSGTLSQTHPEMAEEYSKSNPYDLDWISYTSWYNFDEPLKWKCSECNHEYDILFKRKVLFGDRACPYCNGILPTHEYSLAYVIRIFEPPIQPHDMLLLVLFYKNNVHFFKKVAKKYFQFSRE